MNNFENDQPLTRKSDIISPYTLQDKVVSKENEQEAAEYRGSSPERKSGPKKVRGRTANEELNQLRMPLMPGKKQAINYEDREDLASSIDSSAEVLKVRLSQFRTLKIGISAMMILQIICCAVQISFFAILIKYTDGSCSFKVATAWIIDIFGAFGVLFGMWGVFSYKISNPNKLYQGIVAVGTLLTVLYLVMLVIFAINQSDEAISSCSKYKTNALLSYTLLSSVLVLSLVIQVAGISLLWKLIWEVEKIKSLEQTEQVKAELISKVARDLSVA